MDKNLESIIKDTDSEIVVGSAFRILGQVSAAIVAMIGVVGFYFLWTETPASFLAACSPLIIVLPIAIFGWIVSSKRVVLEFDRPRGYITVSSDFTLAGFGKRVNIVSPVLALQTRSNTDTALASNASTYTLYRVIMPISESEVVTVYAGPDFQKQAYVQSKIIKRAEEIRLARYSRCLKIQYI